MAVASNWQALLQSFVDGRMRAPDFETAFLDAWRNERDGGIRTPRAIDTLFYEVDAYCADPSLRGEHDIGEDELRAAAKVALQNFDQAWPEREVDLADRQHMDNVKRAVKRLFG